MSGEYSVDTEQGPVGPIPNVQRNMLSGSLRYAGSLESRVRNERRLLGSGRGYGRPEVERPYGARSLLYSSIGVAKEEELGKSIFP